MEPRLKTPLITVVITNWNYGMFLRAAIESVLAQTVLPARLIIADDGSTDNSTEIVREYMNFANKGGIPLQIGLLVSKERKGLPANLRASARMVETEWMCFLAADDMMRPTYIEKAVSVIEASDEKLFVVYSDMEKFGLWDGVWEVSDWNEEHLRQGNYINGHAVIRKSIYDEAGGYRTEVDGKDHFFEDYYLYMDIINLGKGYYGKRIPEPLIMYRRHDFGHRTDNNDINKRS